jgi:hypothetical protein
MGEPNTRTAEQDTEIQVPSIEQFDTPEKIRNLLETPDDQLLEQLTNPKDPEYNSELEKEVPGASVKKEVTPTKKTGTAQPVVLDLGDGKTIQFDNVDSLKNNFISLRKGLDEINAKYGRTNQELLRVKGLEGQYADLQRQFEELKRGQTQAANGQKPTVSKETIQKAEELGVDLSDLTPENFLSKMTDFRKAVALEAKAELRKEYEPVIQEMRDKNQKLEERFGKIEGDMTHREQESVFQRHYTNLMSEVTKLQEKVGAPLKTQWSVDQINDAIVKYGPDQAKLVLPPGDFDKWVIIEDMLKETYCPTDAQGNLDITQRKLKNIDMAFAAYSTMHPELAGTDLATAHTNGQTQVLDAIERVAGQPPKLPNNLAGQQDVDKMTAEEAERYINTPVDDVNKWKKANDPRYGKWLEAQDFIAKMT